MKRGTGGGRKAKRHFTNAHGVSRNATSMRGGMGPSLTSPQPGPIKTTRHSLDCPRLLSTGRCECEVIDPG